MRSPLESIVSHTASCCAPAWLQRDLLVRAARCRVAARAVDLHASELHRNRGGARLQALGLAVTACDRPSCADPARFVLDEGHIDAVDAEFEDGELAISIHDERSEPGVERDPSQVVFVVKPAAKLEIPDDRFGFLGPAGTTVWVLPDNQLDAQSLGVLFLGLSAEEIEPGTFVDDMIHVRFRQVIGPDGFSLFESPRTTRRHRACSSTARTVSPMWSRSLRRPTGMRTGRSRPREPASSTSTSPVAWRASTESRG